MDIHQPLPLLGGLTPQTFMRRHWQKKPLLVRQAIPGVKPPLTRRALLDLAERDEVESRLIARRGDVWTLRHGPLSRRSVPPFRTPRWTVLVQGLNLHVPAADALLELFRFVPEARLDDLMISYASDGGGVGPHLDSYDVFLLQVHGKRHWRIGPVTRADLEPGLPLKILRDFQPQQEWVLEPGDLLYLPPRWGHDGEAVGECMTCSIGFRAPRVGELAASVLGRLAEQAADDLSQAQARSTDAGQEPRSGVASLYRDPQQAATANPGAIPAGLRRASAQAVLRVLKDPAAWDRALGEVLSEPKPRVWFVAGRPWQAGQDVALAAGSILLYDEQHLFFNGESYRVAGRDARLLQRLSDEHRLAAADVARLSDAARQELSGWMEEGWVVARPQEGA